MSDIIKTAQLLEEAPNVGDTIYVESNDTVSGGYAFVSKVEEGISGGKPAIFVRTGLAPEISYNWEFLGPKQEDLKSRHRDNSAQRYDEDDTPDEITWRR